MLSVYLPRILTCEKFEKALILSCLQPMKLNATDFIVVVRISLGLKCPQLLYMYVEQMAKRYCEILLRQV